VGVDLVRYADCKNRVGGLVVDEEDYSPGTTQALGYVQRSLYMIHRQSPEPK